MAKLSDLRAMSDEELGRTLDDTQKKLFELRFQAATNRLEKIGAIRVTRREIARILTLTNERTRAQAKK